MNEFEPIVTGFSVLRSHESAAEAPVNAPAPTATMTARIATRIATRTARLVERRALRRRARSRREPVARVRVPFPLPFRAFRPFEPRPLGPRPPLLRAGGI